MDKNKGFIKIIGRVCIYGIIVLGAIFAIYRDAQSISNYKYGEISFTEWFQNLFLILSASIYGHIAYKFPVCRKTAILFAGLTLILLIRELDYYFDFLFHGAWFYFVLFLLFYLIHLFIKEKQRIMKDLTEYFTTSTFGILLSSSVSIFIFSRFFGKRNLRMSIFETEHLSATQRWVKIVQKKELNYSGTHCFLLQPLKFYIFFTVIKSI